MTGKLIHGMLVATLLLGSCSVARAEGPEEQHQLLLQGLLDSIPEDKPTGCVGASMVFSDLTSVVGVMAACDDTSGFFKVYAAVEDYCQASDPQARRILLPVQMSCAYRNYRMGDLEKAFRQLASAHALAMDLHHDLEKLSPLLDRTGDIEVYPDDGCTLILGTRVMTIVLADWLGMAEGLDEEHVSPERLSALKEMKADLEPLVPVYAEQLAKVEKIMK